MKRPTGMLCARDLGVRKTTPIISWVVFLFFFFRSTSLTHSISNCAQCSIIRKKVQAVGRTLLPVFCPPCSLREVWDSSQERWAHIQPGKAASAPFLLLLHEMSPEQHEILDRRCGDTLWHKYLCCLAVGGRLWEDLSQAPPAKSESKEMVIRRQGCPGSNPAPTSQ